MSTQTPNPTYRAGRPMSASQTVAWMGIAWIGVTVGLHKLTGDVTLPALAGLAAALVVAAVVQQAWRVLRRALVEIGAVACCWAVYAWFFPAPQGGAAGNPVAMVALGMVAGLTVANVLRIFDHTRAGEARPGRDIS